jgi:hypothetical protein
MSPWKYLCVAGRLVVLAMMLVGVVLIPVRASQLYSRLNERRLMSGHPPVSSSATTVLPWVWCVSFDQMSYMHAS